MLAIVTTVVDDGANPASSLLAIIESRATDITQLDLRTRSEEAVDELEDEASIAQISSILANFPFVTELSIEPFDGIFREDVHGDDLARCRCPLLTHAIANVNEQACQLGEVACAASTRKLTIGFLDERDGGEILLCQYRQLDLSPCALRDLLDSTEDLEVLDYRGSMDSRADLNGEHPPADLSRRLRSVTLDTRRSLIETRIPLNASAAGCNGSFPPLATRPANRLNRLRSTFPAGPHLSFSNLRPLKAISVSSRHSLLVSFCFRLPRTAIRLIKTPTSDLVFAYFARDNAFIRGIGHLRSWIKGMPVIEELHLDVLAVTMHDGLTDDDDDDDDDDDEAGMVDVEAHRTVIGVVPELPTSLRVFGLERGKLQFRWTNAEAKELEAACYAEANRGTVDRAALR